MTCPLFNEPRGLMIKWKGKIAKGGLHQYKGISQNTIILTIEIKEKVQEAQAKADQITLDGLDDLEATETFEPILLSTVSGEQNKDRADHVVVTHGSSSSGKHTGPCWALSGTMLVSRLFTKPLPNSGIPALLEKVAKYAHQPHSINLSEPESLQHHLDTRFHQLNAAAELELWHEAFRSVEDIHNLMKMSKKMPKPFMLVNYYQDHHGLSKNVLKHVRLELRELYNILEVQFYPLSICKKIEPIMGKLAADAELVKYVKPLHQVILTHFQQLSQVYTNVKLDFVIQLASFLAPFNYDSAAIEKFIMQRCKKGELSIRIATQSLAFETDLFASGNKTVTDGPILQSLPSNLMRTPLTRLATCLNTTVSMISPEIVEANKEAKRAAFIKTLTSMMEERKLALERKAIIERKNELIETMLARKEEEEEEEEDEEEEAHEKALRLHAKQEGFKSRLVEERRKREEERISVEQEAICLKNEAESLKNKAGVELDDEDLDTLDKDKLVAIQIKQLEKEKRRDDCSYQGHQQASGSRRACHAFGGASSVGSRERVLPLKCGWCNNPMQARKSLRDHVQK
ncbi:eukaryotic translation initiation factor 3 subunit A, partial [Mortierella sp. NVP85]